MTLMRELPKRRAEARARKLALAKKAEREANDTTAQALAPPDTAANVDPLMPPKSSKSSKSSKFWKGAKACAASGGLASKKSSKTAKSAKSAKALRLTSSGKQIGYLKPGKTGKPTQGVSISSGTTKLHHKGRSVLLANRQRLKVKGILAPNGVRYINISDGARSVWSPKAHWAGSSRSALNDLTSGNIIIVGSASDLCEAVKELRTYPPTPVIEQVGWTGNTFVLPNHMVISPPGEAGSVVLFEAKPRVCDHTGTLEGWRSAIEPLAGQSLCELYIMAGFAAPLLPLADLSFNPGLELAGPAASGKTALLRLVASIAGPGLDSPNGRYMIDLNATANGIETVFARFRHMPMVADEAALFMPTASGNKRKDGMVELIFRNAAGSTKFRHGDGEQVVTPFVWFVSTNQSHMSMLSSLDAALQVAMSDRLMSTPIDADRPHGIFDTLPDQFHNASEFIGSLMTGIAANHGVAMPAFLERLIQDRTANAEAFDQRVRSLIGRFMRQVGADQTGSISRAARAFGLFYAAGRLARRYRIIPRSFDCLEAASACYALHCAEGRSDLTPYERLVSLSRHPEVVDIDACNPQDWTKERAERIPGFWHTNRQGVREFLVLPRQIVRIFPRWFWDQHDPEIERVRYSDKDHGTVGRIIPGVGKTPVHCFIFPADED